MERTSEKGLKVRLFGRFEVWLDKKLIPPTAWPQRKTQTLLKVLLTERGRVFTQDQLIEYLFPELDPQMARKSLYGRISELRHLLEPKLKRGRDSQYILRVEGGGYCFSKEVPCWLDTEEFEKHCELAHKLAETHQWLQAIKRYQRAMDLYRGPYLAENLYEEWSLAPREHWREIHLRALGQQAECHARLAQYEQAIELCRRVIEVEPYRESAYRAKMLYHYYAGEQLEAKQTYQACVKVLKEELEVEPSHETQELYELILQGQVPPLPRVIPNNLPIPPTCFIGREAELAEMRKLLGDPSCRLLILTGLGGVGKTHLAIQAASEALEGFSDGAFFVSLDHVSSPDLLVSTLVGTLEFPLRSREDPKRQLSSYLREKKMLLVLDNFEHLAAGAGLLTEILEGTAQVKLLVTSRERLNLQGEWLLPIQGLSFPPGEQIEDAEGYSAVQLFLCHARRVQPGFTLSPEEKSSVVRICQLLEGMPLGIELAAVWVRVLSCREIASEIAHNVNFLATSSRDVPERHRSLRAVFDHSWRLLTGDERGVLQKLSVFRGGFTREAAERVAGATLPLLTALIDRSLLRRSSRGRYELHELLRRYTEERLKEDVQQYEQTRERHGEYYARFLEERKGTLLGAQQREVLKQISEELENVRASWRWAVEPWRAEELEKALESLYLFYDLQSRFQEGAEVFQEAIAAAPAGKKSLLLGQLLGRTGYFYYHLGRYEEGKALLSESLAIARSGGDTQEAAFSLNGLGLVACMVGEYVQANRLFQESLTSSRKIADIRGSAIALKNRGNVAYRLGEYAKAKRLYEKSLALSREIADRWGMAGSLNNLGNVALMLGEYTEAKRLLQESLAMKSEIGDRWGMATSLNNLGEVATALREYTEAKELYQESLALKREIGDRQGMALCCNNLGFVATMLEEYVEAKRLYGECLAMQREIGDRWGIANSLNNLARVAMALEEEREAKDCLQEALRTAMGIGAVPVVFGSVIGIARLFVKAGEKERAAELLALILRHAAIDKETQDEAECLLLGLASELSSQVLEAAQRRAEAKTLEEVVEKLLSGPTC